GPRRIRPGACGRDARLPDRGERLSRGFGGGRRPPGPAVRRRPGGSTAAGAARVCARGGCFRGHGTAQPGLVCRAPWTARRRSPGGGLDGGGGRVRDRGGGVPARADCGRTGGGHVPGSGGGGGAARRSGVAGHRAASGRLPGASRCRVPARHGCGLRVRGGGLRAAACRVPGGRHGCGSAGGVRRGVGLRGGGGSGRRRRAARGADPPYGRDRHHGKDNGVNGLRIALVLATSSGGVGSHVRSLSRGLVAQGHRVAVVGPEATEQRFDFTGTGARFAPLEVADRPRPFRDLAALLRLNALLAGADVVHAHGARAGALVALSGAAAPLVVTMHNAPPAGGGAWLFGFLEQILVCRADLVLGVSSDLVERARTRGARRVARALVPAPPAAPSGRDPEQIRAELGVEPGQPLLV